MPADDAGSGGGDWAQAAAPISRLAAQPTRIDTHARGRGHRGSERNGEARLDAGWMGQRCRVRCGAGTAWHYRDDLSDRCLCDRRSREARTADPVTASPMTTSTPTADPRVRLLCDWLARQPAAWQIDVASLRAASADASFRRYFRIDAPGYDGGTLIVMDAPPEKEDTRPFIAVAGLLAEAGLNAPAIVARNVEHGYLLLSDLGTETYLAALQRAPERADALFADAIGALVKWQLASRPGVLPPYDAALLQREIQLFPDWYVERHLRHTPTSTEKEVFAQQSRLVVDTCLAQPPVYVHRDFMPRNLMVSQPNPGILDFQDAVYGPIPYDIVSLMRDAFISWDEERVLDWTVHYWQAARLAGLPVAADFADFYRAFEWMGLQRHLKVLGIFARINYRDGKPHYLADTPRFVRYVRAVTRRYGALLPLARLFDALEGVAARVGYTF
jgi:aminoglycoside/choline kinase family phosphotransferase